MNVARLTRRTIDTAKAGKRSASCPATQEFPRTADAGRGGSQSPSAAPNPSAQVYELCRRIGAGSCGCAVREQHPCAELQDLLDDHGSVEAAHAAELRRMEQVARCARW